MEILCYSGIPGSGKTFHATYNAIEHYKKENKRNNLYYLLSLIPFSLFNFARDKVRYIQTFPHNRINNVYSSYPILLDKKRKIYSNKYHILDFDNKHSFLPNAAFFDDEIQLKIDSDEYTEKKQKDIIAKIAKFMQSARHFGCSSIVITTQHPSRLFKKARNVASGFVHHKILFHIPIIHLGLFRFTHYFILEDYGKYVPRNRRERRKIPFEYKRKYKWLNFKKIGSCYDSRYLSEYNYGLPLLDRGLWESSKVSRDLLETYYSEKN